MSPGSKAAPPEVKLSPDDAAEARGGEEELAAGDVGGCICGDGVGGAPVRIDDEPIELGIGGIAVLARFDGLVEDREFVVECGVGGVARVDLSHGERGLVAGTRHIGVLDAVRQPLGQHDASHGLGEVVGGEVGAEGRAEVGDVLGKRDVGDGGGDAAARERGEIDDADIGVNAGAAAGAAGDFA